MSEFVPRLDKDGIYNNKFWYSDNPFFNSNYGLPNCTCYAWGRFWEIRGKRPSSLSTGNGGDWFDDTVKKGNFKTGNIPSLGAIACFGKVNGAGHVCIVEEVHKDGSFVTSNSGYHRPIEPYPPDTRSYFFISQHKTDGMATWMSSDYFLQGFIYVDNFVPPEPPIPHTKIDFWKFFMLIQKRRGLHYGSNCTTDN